MDAIQISNMAISLVGGSSITSFADPILEAEQCDLYYNVARRYCLENRDWTFAAETRRLTKDVMPISSEYTYSYALPADCLVVRVVAADANLRDVVEYQRQSNRVITDSATLYIRYTKDVTSSTLFSSGFATAVAHKLAEFIAPSITGDKGLKRTLMQEADYLITEGGANEGMQGSPKRAFASRLLRARFYGGSRNWFGKYI